ncbi:protein kinase MEC1 KNAG_0B01240 [Huiozyma naganishii CBS 8797]|uniref:Serine/threonine-protein kinase MEC1 n=1 Tax=Huiozyma naganishii (strain ATCC MYA-139 / BCRC 22969 / CBS 8797 / KCTC 17520 / NBRC 10181 / NCYC 3082 / Yp74L-3) TaxID=1071383 RepID=J7S4H4_HUIN7|nr:hypothetical protein KNAG_0B01240 [Kazachstania naganishii CBS 8797]CCK68571.1 hypothetical protein KNAG_0B01240 [Kazachstania naganishii CBS 8797]
MMDSRVKYLDELILHINESRLVSFDNVDQNDSDEDLKNSNSVWSKSLRVLETLMKILLGGGIAEPHRVNQLNDTIFAKTVEALNALIKTNPSILSDRRAFSDSERQLGIVKLMDDVLHASLLYREDQHRLWYLREKLGAWCQLSEQAYSGSISKLELSSHLQEMLNTLERRLVKVTAGNYPVDKYMADLKRLYILCYWMCAPNSTFGESLTYFDTTIGTKKWTLVFERMIRLVVYVFETSKLESVEYSQLQLKFLSMSVDYLINNSCISTLNRSKILLNDKYGFVLSVLHQFISNRIGKSQSPNDPTLAKCILRLYSLTIQSDSQSQEYVKTFAEYFPLTEWFDIDHLSDERLWPGLDYNDLTLKAFILIHFDIQRRASSLDKISLDKKFHIYKTSDHSDERVMSIIVKSYGQEFKQLERLRILVLNKFSPTVRFVPTLLKYELNSVEPGILQRTGNDHNSLFDEIKKSVKTCVNTENFRKLACWTRIIGRLACFERYLLIEDKYTLDRCYTCPVCEGYDSSNVYQKVDPERPDAETKSRTYQIIHEVFLSNPKIYDFSEGLLSGLLLCLQRIYVHFQPPSLKRAASDGPSESFALVENCRNNKNRYLRVLSTRVFPLLNITDLRNQDDQNAMILAKYLESPKDSILTESRIMSWTYFVMTTSGELFDTLMMKLMDIFNSDKFAIYSMITFQIKNMSRILHKTPYQLLLPILPLQMKYYGSALVEKRYTFTRLTELLGFSEKTVLGLFQQHIVPYAVMNYKTNVFETIKKIMFNGSTEEINMQVRALLKDNSRQIFAVALVKHKIFSSDSLETLFTNILPNFEKEFVISYLPDYRTAAAVIKLYQNNEAEDHKGNEDMVLCSLRYLNTDFQANKRRGTKFKDQSNWTSEQEMVFQSKLKDVILGILQVFSGDMHNTRVKTTYYEKLRVINGISFLIKFVNKTTIVSALAQIGSCLQTGLEIEEIRYNCYRSWLLLVELLNVEELSTVIDGLIAFTLQNWGTFNRKLRTIVYQILDTIIEKKGDLIFQLKPSITFALNRKSDLDLSNRNNKFAKKVRHTLTATDFIAVFISNLQSNNKRVLLQNLDDIEAYLKGREKDGPNFVYSKRDHKTEIALLLAALLDTAHKYRTEDVELCENCMRCISIIGVLDVTSHSFRSLYKSGEIYFLEDETDVINFLVWIMNDVLVPSFWQSDNPRRQLFVALVMQESLKHCGLSVEQWDATSTSGSEKEQALWHRFDTIAQTTLFPLRSSQYIAQSSVAYEPRVYPSFVPTQEYRMWVKNLTLDLLKSGTTEEHPLHVFSSLIREDDGYLSNLLLPYLVMEVIVKAKPGTEYENLMNGIIVEFSFIFKFNIEGMNRLQMDSIKMCYESIFAVMEHCKKWVTKFKKMYIDHHGTSVIEDHETSQKLKRIDLFLHSIPAYSFALRSLETSSFERSALYLEECYRHPDSLPSSVDKKTLLNHLKVTYEEIGDIDSIDGILKSFASDNLVSKIEELQYSSNWKMAQDCFSALGNFSVESPNTTKMLKSMYDHQLYSQVVKSSDLLLPTRSFRLETNMNDLYNMTMECVNMFGDTESLEKWINNIEKLCEVPDQQLLLQYNVAKALYFVTKNDHSMTQNYLNKCFRLAGVRCTTNASATTLLKQQNMLMKLHSLYDLSLLSSANNKYEYDDIVTILNHRMKRIGADFRPNHHLLSMRRSFELLKSNGFARKDLIQTVYKIAQLARNNSRLDVANDALMQCLQYEHPQAELEFAEILWKKGENDRALKLVKEIHEKCKDEENSSNEDRAVVLLKYTEWLDLSNNSSSDQIIKQYNEIIQLHTTWGLPHESMALYYSRLLERKEAENYRTDGTYEYNSVTHFLRAFEMNPSKAREYLPKVVTFWLKIASKAEHPKDSNLSLQTVASNICQAIKSTCGIAPIYIWYSVLTQLLSRLLHPHLESHKLITSILCKLTDEYPSHMLWYMAVLTNSESSERKKSGRGIIEIFKRGHADKQAMVSSSINLTIALTRVCIQETKTVTSRSGNMLAPDFRFDMNLAPCDLAVPVRINLEMISPRLSESMSNYKPFRSLVTIQSFGKRYKVFTSLKKPKQLSIVGSDGARYGIMCKKEDVRQDNQYMQFATTMDFLLNKDVESSKRDLNITTYSVLSLREDCGLIEMVPNVITLRKIFDTRYQSMNITFSTRTLIEKVHNASSSKKLSIFSQQLRKFPSVLYQWFLDTFPDPIDWFNARNTFARSHAVMAMVGYIVGLGDRHCENILLDIDTGKVLHVDFDCLFEKGKLLPTPEIVPFRLTQNLYDALGVVGTEGTFKKSSEVALNLMRSNEVALMNVIETIIYDRNSDTLLRQGLRTLRNKIRGIDPRDGLVLSVPGQVETLIQEATSDQNLSKMYMGWMPFW